MSKITELSSFITNLVKNQVNINIIAVQEIGSIQYPELDNIPGFEFICTTRKNAQGGGVAFYIKHGISFKIQKSYPTSRKESLNV